MHPCQGSLVKENVTLAFTDQEHKRFQDLQTEMIDLVRNTPSDQASAAFGRISRICKAVLAREAESRTSKEGGSLLKTARQERESRRNGTNGRGPATTSSGTA